MVDKPAQAAARAWLHEYGINTSQYTDGGGDHPAMRSLPDAFEAFATRAADAEIARLVSCYQDKLVDAINDPRHFDGERVGLQMAAALFRSELKRLGIPNVPVGAALASDTTTEDGNG